jgi:hypothetical protein
MTRRDDLERLIRESYEIILEYEETIQTSNRGEEKLRAQRQIDRQWKLIESYLEECTALVGGVLPPDIAEIATRFSQTESLRAKELAYLDDLLKRYEYWHDHYTPLAGIAEVRAAVKDGPRLDLPMPFIPREFETLVKHGFGEREKVRREQFGDLREAIAEHRRIILLGDPGSGKTTTLWRLVYDYAQTAQEVEQAPVPVFVPLGGYTDDSPFNAYLARHLGPLTTHLEAYLASGRLILLLDGLNEMPQAEYEKRVGRIRTTLERHPDAMAVVTCRTLDYVVKLEKLQEVEVSPLDEDRIRVFLRNYLGWTAGERLFQKMDRWSLLDLCQNPYMLLMTAQVYVSAGGELPVNRAHLVTAFVDTLLKREEKRHAEEWIEGKDQKDSLAALAYAMQSEGEKGTIVERGWALGHLCQAVPGCDTQRLLYLAASATLLDIDDATVRFRHQLLQEYFSGRFFVEIASDNELVLLFEHLADDHWREVFVLTASLLDDANIFFDLFTQALEKLVYEDETIIEMMRWAQRGAAAIKKAALKPVTVRSFYLSSFPKAASALLLAYDLDPPHLTVYNRPGLWGGYTRVRNRVWARASQNGEHKWDLTTEQAQLLDRYLAACHIYVRCLVVANVSNREELENRLLLPPEAKP